MRKKTVIFIIVLVVIAIFVGVSHKKTNAAVELPDGLYKLYGSMTPKYGETVWSLYDRACDIHPDTADYYTRQAWMKEVRSINSLDWEYSIHAGDRLVYPYYGIPNDL